MPSYAYFKKKFVPLAEANINIMTHALHYGTGIFEGIRGNWNEDQQQILNKSVHDGIIIGVILDR